MKNLLLKTKFAVTAILILICLFTKAQVKTKIFKDEIPLRFKPTLKSISKETILNPPQEFNKLVNESKTIVDDRFASSLHVDIDFNNQAEKFKENNFQIYALRITAKDALNISVEFGRFQLSKNAVLSIYTNNELTDSITSIENNENNMWATRVYQGAALNIVLKEPLNETPNSIIKISKVNFGYKKYGIQFGHPGASAPCEINVNCPAGNGWDNEKNSVALIVANGSTACTGTLIMNTCNTNIPYLLTANHCLSAGNVNNWVFQFQYWSATCTPNSGWNEDVQYNGCQLRSNNAASDFTLLRLNQSPPANSNIRYAGWSRQIVDITSTTLLHHPSGDLMKITRDINPPAFGNFLGAQCWHLIVDNGTTEGGSSGAPYFDQNHRIIGQHYGIDDGNLPICNQVSKYGGRFDLSWTGGGTNVTRLSNWLDPSNTGALTTNTTDVSNLINASPALSISGNADLCSTASYTLNGATTGTITWASSDTNVATVTIQGNPTTVTTIGNGSVFITATVTFCPGTTSLISKQINVGVATNYYFSNIYVYPDPPAIDVYTSSTGLQQTVTSWSIAVDGVVSRSDNGYPPAITTVNGGTSCGSHTVTLTTYNNCGSYSTNSMFNRYSNCYGYALTPNPANSTVTITSTMDANSKIMNTNKTVEITIFDQANRHLKHFSFTQNTRYSFTVADLLPGAYIVQVKDGNNIDNLKLIKQ